MKLVIALIFTCVISANSQNLPGTGAISGVVLNSASREGIAAANVVIACMTADDPKASCVEHRSKTDEQGAFRIEDLPAGNYLLFAIDPAFVGAGPSSTAVVLAGRDQTGIEIALHPQAVIQGAVSTSSNTPIVGAQVQVFKKQYRDGAVHLKAVGTTTTDKAGVYRIGGLQSGLYYVAAKQEKNGRWFMSPGVLTIEQAQSIKADFGHEYSNINIRFGDVTIHHISGRVIQSPGLDLSSYSVTLSPDKAEVVDVLGESEISGNGNFVFAEVPPDDYILALRKKERSRDGGSFRMHVVAKERVSVGSVDISNLTLDTKPGPTLTGQVDLDQALPAEIGGIKLHLRPADVFSFSDFRDIPVEGNGSFTVQSCETARYSFSIDTPPGIFVDAIELNRQPFSTRFIDFSNIASAHLTIHLKRGTTTINGNIADNLSADIVVIVPTSWTAEGWNGVRSQAVRKGSFAQPNVAPGTYVIVALRSLDDPNQLADPDVMRVLMQEGQTIQVQQGDQKTIQIHAISEISSNER